MDMANSCLDKSIDLPVSQDTLILFLKNFVRIGFVFSHINTLETVNVFWKTGFSNVSFTSFNRFYESIMDEDILLLRLDQSIPLCSDMLEEGKHIEVSS